MTTVIVELSKADREMKRMEEYEKGNNTVDSVIHVFPFLKDGRCAIGDSFCYNRGRFELDYKGYIFSIDNNISTSEIIEIVRQKINEFDPK